MKKLSNALLTFSLLSAMAATTALAQPFTNVTWTFDELGLGLLNGPGLTGYVLGANQMDPMSGIATLYYNWGAPTVPGDVLLFEPLAGTNRLSDVLRFDGQGGMYFFSEREPTEINPDPADVFLLPQPQPGAIGLLEIGPEGNNGAFYAPGPGQPGFDISGILPGVSYNFISDVPEPTSVGLLLIGAGIVRFRMRRGKHALRG